MLLIASLIPIVTAPSIQPEPIDSNDDAFITGVGNYFGDTPYLFLRDQTTSLLIGTRFRNVAIPQGEKINNATLFVRTIYNYGYPYNRTITATIRGDDTDDSLAFNDSGSFTRTYTEANVVWDISDVYANAWHNVTVTNIVQEIIDRPGWSSGNDLSLLFWATKGTPRREFASVDGNPAYTAYIDINYGITPPPEEIEDIQDDAPTPYNDSDIWEWEYNDTYRGIDTYTATNYGDLEILVVASDTLNYFNTTKGDPNYVNWIGDTFDWQESGSCEFITSLNGWTFLVGQNGTNLYVFYSDDEFTTWRADRVNSHFPLSAASNFGSIWADQNGSALIHLVWSTRSAWSAGKYDIVYSNFTLDPVTENLVWSTSYSNVTVGYGDDQIEPDMYQEKDGTIHIVWHGINGTANEIAQYRRRQANGTWLDAVRLSGDAPFRAFGVDVVANEETGVALATWSRVNPGDWEVQWDIVFPNNTVGTAVGSPDRILSNAAYVSVVNYRENNTAHLVYEDFSGDHVEYRYKAIDNVTAWSGSQLVSTTVNRYHYPSISLDEKNETLAVIYWGIDDGDTFISIFQTEGAPSGVDTLLLGHPLRYPSNADYCSRTILDVTWWLVYPNGTLVTPGPVDPDDIKDLIDDLLGGAQPEDPEPDEYKVIDKFRWKLLVLCIGMIMMVGSPLAGVVYGADTATWIKLLFVAFFGLGILWQINYM